MLITWCLLMLQSLDTKADMCRRGCRHHSTVPEFDGLDYFSEVNPNDKQVGKACVQVAAYASSTTL